MNQQELAKELSTRSGLSASVCSALITEMFASISGALLAGEEVTFSDFGTFCMDGRVTYFSPLGLLDAKKGDPAASGFTRVTETQVIRPEEARAKALSSRGKKEPQASAKDAAVPRSKPASKRKAESKAPEEGTHLSSFAQDILGLESGELERGLGLADQSAAPAKGRRLTFPVQISRQAKDHSSRFWRPTNGEERRSFKDLALKNFFVTLGSVVRDRVTHEPMLVFDVSDVPSPKGERYQIQLLRVKWEESPSESQRRGKADGEHSHELKFDEVEFDPEQHEVMMVIDPSLGPRVHSFDIGTFKANDRRDRAEVCLAQEYECFRAEGRS